MERKATCCLSWALVALAAVGVLLASACGPAAESTVSSDQPGQRVAQSEEATPTPTPTPTPTSTPQEKYPNLDETLQRVVGGYEAETWTEVEAARQAPESHGSTVLIEIDTTADKIDAIDTWMGEQSIEPRFKDPDYSYSPHIYAYAPVSKLGALSLRDGIVKVYAVEDPEADSREPQGVGGQVGSTEPKLPTWMKGYPYPKLSSLLQDVVYRYEQGTITAEQAVQEVASLGVEYKNTSIPVDVIAEGQKASTTNPIAEWLVQKGVPREDFDVFGPGVAGLIPISLLAELSSRPGVLEIRGPEVGGMTPYIEYPDEMADRNAPDPFRFTPDRVNPKPTPTPTPTPQEKYPNLDETLQKVVGGYEAGTWTEQEAARQAPESHGVTVLTETYAAPDKIDALDTWMDGESINPRFKDANYAYSPHIYAYVPVSKLGALSKRDGVVTVMVPPGPDPNRMPPRGFGGQEGGAEPRLPPWLMGYPSPKLSSLLHSVVYRYEEGLITAEEAVQEVARAGGEHGRTSVEVNIRAKEDAYDGTTNTVAVWLIQKGVPEDDFGVVATAVIGLVPVSLLNELSLRNDVVRIWGPEMGRVRELEWDSEAAPSQETLEKYGMKPDTQRRPTPTPTPTPMPTPTPVVSQGVGAHGATAWQSTHTGTDVKIGVLDTGFRDFSALQKRGEVPPSTKLSARCYTSDRTLAEGKMKRPQPQRVPGSHRG